MSDRFGNILLDKILEFYNVIFLSYRLWIPFWPNIILFLVFVQGLKLELCTTDRVGLLSDVTRIFRENSLTVTRAEVTTRAGKALNIFYVRDSSGYPVDAKIIESVRQTIGQTILRVKGNIEELNPVPQESPTRFLFGGLFKSRSFCNFGLVRSYSWKLRS